MFIVSSVDSHGFRATVTYTTRWRLDFSTPPLKIVIASPVKSSSAREQQKKCIRNGRTEIADRVPGDWL